MAKLRYPIIFFLRLKKGRININLKTLIFSKVRVFTRRFFILGNIKISKFDYRFPRRPHYKRCLRDTISNKNTHIPFFRSKITSFQDGSERNETRERERERFEKNSFPTLFPTKTKLATAEYPSGWFHPRRIGSRK